MSVGSLLCRLGARRRGGREALLVEGDRERRDDGGEMGGGDVSDDGLSCSLSVMERVEAAL
jgi:hypothetical protein